MGIQQALFSSVPGLGPMLSFASIGMQAYGAYSSSKKAQTAYNAQAQVARNNAQVAEWQAQDALKRGERGAMKVRMQGNQLKGQQRAQFASNGVDLGTGSALQIFSDTDYFTDVDANTVLENAAKEAWAHRSQGAGYSADASLMASRAAAESPWLPVGSTLLTGASRVASTWYAKEPNRAPSSGGGLGVPGFSAIGTYG